MDNVIVEKSFKFAVKIVRLVEKLRNNHVYEIASQLIRSGTSIGANVSEAQYSQSKKDFASKMHIALKEANETQYWLRLLAETELIRSDEAKTLVGDTEELKRILSAILKTAYQTK